MDAADFPRASFLCEIVFGCLVLVSVLSFGGFVGQAKNGSDEGQQE